MTTDQPPLGVPRSWLWAAAYWTALAAMVADANLGVLADPWRWMLKVLVVILVVPMLVFGRREAVAEGPPSRALDTYNYRVMFGVGACVAVFSIGAAVYRGLAPGSPVLWLLALVSAVPLLFVIWAMARYLRDEADEYLRHLAIMSALIGLAAVLVLATIWGFLENLRLVPHVWSWYVVPLFAVSYGLGRAWLKARNR